MQLPGQFMHRRTTEVRPSPTCACSSEVSSALPLSSSQPAPATPSESSSLVSLPESSRPENTLSSLSERLESGSLRRGGCKESQCLITATWKQVVTCFHVHQNHPPSLGPPLLPLLTEPALRADTSIPRVLQQRDPFKNILALWSPVSTHCVTKTNCPLLTNSTPYSGT